MRERGKTLRIQPSAFYSIRLSPKKQKSEEDTSKREKMLLHRSLSFFFFFSSLVLAVSSLPSKTLLWHLVPHLEGILILASRLSCGSLNLFLVVVDFDSIAISIYLQLLFRFRFLLTQMVWLQT
jgi:hypothetical protein